MNVTCLRAGNFKGRTFEHDLSPITIFAGPNSSGKSARLEALQLALAGFVPGCPATPGGIAEAFSGGMDMTVGVIIGGFDLPGQGGLMLAGATHRGVVRSFRHKGKSVQREDKWDKLPVDWAVQPVAVDAAEYLSLPEKQRVRVLFKMAKLKRVVNAQTVTAEFKNIKLEDNTKVTEEFLASLCASVESRYKKAMYDGQTVQEWIIDLCEFVRKSHLTTKQNCERMNLTVQGITELRSRQPPSDGSIQDCERRLAAAAKEQDRLAKELGRIESDMNGAGAGRKKADELDRQLAGPLADCTALRDKAQSNLNDLLAKHGQKPGVQSLRKRQTEVERAGQILKYETDALEHQITVEQRNLEEKLSHEKCPYCKSNKPGWQNVIKAESEERIKTLTEQRNAKKPLRIQLSHEYTSLSAQIKDMAKGVIAWETQDNQIAMWRREIAERNDCLSRRAEVQKQRAEIVLAETSNLKHQHAITLAALDGARQARQVLDSDRMRLSGERIEALQKIQAAEQAQNALNEVVILKAALAAVEALCEQLVNESIKPLIDKVNALCGIIMPAPLEYLDGEIGWHEGGAWISKPKQLGGARRTLLFAALSVALSEPGGIIIIDEYRNLDETNRRAVIVHFDRLIDEGVIGQVIMADPDVSDILGMANERISFIEMQCSKQ